MSRCMELVSSVGSSESYSESSTSLINCGDSSTSEYLVMSRDDYNFVIDASIAESTTFDTEAYEIGYDGIIQSWVIGLGIGLILALLAKLKR